MWKLVCVKTLRTCLENVVGQASRLLWGVSPRYFRGRDARSSQAGGPRHYSSDTLLESSRLPKGDPNLRPAVLGLINWFLDFGVFQSLPISRRPITVCDS